MKALQLLDLSIGPDLHELTRHGTALFPCAGYEEDPGKYLTGKIPWHWHEEFEFILAVEGETNVLCGKAEYVISAGDGVFINSNVMHKLRRTHADKPTRINSLVFKPELVAGFPQSIVQQRYIQPLIRCPALASTLLRRNDPWQKKAIEHFEAAFSAYNSELYGYEMTVQIELLNMIRRIICSQADYIDENDFVQSKDSTRIKQMVSFIQEHYAEPLTVAQIADASSISESECYRCFRKLLDTSPIDYLLQYRIRIAAGMLAGSDRSVSDICYATGFNSPSYFAKVFRHALQSSPRAYRKSRNNAQRLSSQNVVRSQTD